jgi:hypothetical protein
MRVSVCCCRDERRPAIAVPQPRVRPPLQQHTQGTRLALHQEHNIQMQVQLQVQVQLQIRFGFRFEFKFEYTFRFDSARPSAPGPPPAPTAPLTHSLGPTHTQDSDAGSASSRFEFGFKIRPVSKPQVRPPEGTPLALHTTTYKLQDSPYRIWSFGWIATQDSDHRDPASRIQVIGTQNLHPNGSPAHRECCPVEWSEDCSHVQLLYTSPSQSIGVPSRALIEDTLERSGCPSHRESGPVERSEPRPSGLVDTRPRVHQEANHLMTTHTRAMMRMMMMTTRRRTSLE